MSTVSNRLARKPARLFLATLVVALAGTLTLTAEAAPAGPGRAERGGMGMMGDARHVDRMLDLVSASGEQRSQVKQIMETAAVDLKAQREAGRALRDQASQLFAQPTVDARAVEALRQKMLTQHDQSSKRMMQALLDTSRVLTPEQRKQLAEHMGQRQGMMERHQAERLSLDKPVR
jgi:periplasmic protein CpxP/Spy